LTIDAISVVLGLVASVNSVNKVRWLRRRIM